MIPAIRASCSIGQSGLEPAVLCAVHEGRLWAVRVDVSNGGNRTFAAGANQIGQLEESRRSERRASFFDVQMQPMAARSPFFTALIPS